jgi:hypothetical protein
VLPVSSGLHALIFWVFPSRVRLYPLPDPFALSSTPDRRTLRHAVACQPAAEFQP